MTVALARMKILADVCQHTSCSMDIRIVLDGVFNHVGRGFWAFRDVQEKKWDSPYKDWFHISFDGNSCYNDGFWYEGWEGHFELVKLNLQNPAVVPIICWTACADGLKNLTLTDSVWMLRTAWITTLCEVSEHFTHRAQTRLCTDRRSSIR